MSSLVDHARVELEKTHEEPDTIDWYLTVIHAFASYGHSGGSAASTIPVIMKLLNFENLTPLTDDPEEWSRIPDHIRSAQSIKESQGLWQNRRRSEAFSHNAGKTYYLLGEGGSDASPYPQHKSEDYRK